MIDGRRRHALRALLVLGALIATGGVGTRASAQTTTKLNNLSFGTILTGTTSTVTLTSGNAAEWQYHQTLALVTSFTFTLPTAMTRTGGGGSIPLTFCSTCAAYRGTTNDPSGATTFNPASGTTTPVSLSNVYVWLAASVTPPLNQPPGSYSASVTLTVAALL